MNPLLEQVSKERLFEMLAEEKKRNDEIMSLLEDVQGKGKKASEKDLDNLQGNLAKVMSEQVLYTEKAIELNDEGEMSAGEERFIASPALLGVIEKFLKNNSIITNISTNENLQQLQQALDKRKKHSSTLPNKKKIANLRD